MTEENILTETEKETETGSETEKPQRRKGQPKGKDIRPLHVRTAKTSAMWVMAAGIGVFILMLAFWSQMNVKLILDAAKAMGETAAEAVDKDAALRVTECFLELREGAPDAPTDDYKADEQVVVLARYDSITEDEDYKALQAYLSDVSGRYPYAGEFSLVGVSDDQLIYLVSPQHRTGYAASLDRIDTAGPEHYDISRPESRREGTVVLVPLGIKAGGMELEISCSYSYGGVLSGEAGHLAIALAIVAICAGICAFRMVWIILRDNG